MKFFDPNNPNEKKKMIAAGALGLVAIVVLGYVFFGGSSTQPANRIAGRPSPSPRGGATPLSGPPDGGGDDLSVYQPIVYPVPLPPASEANRNVFAFYEPPPSTPKPVIVQTPPPTPTPPVMASSLSPSNVYARTPADFTLQLSGDKFTPTLHIVMDGRDLPTRFIS